MTFASVRAAAQHIAKAGAITPHQLAALTRLDELLTDEQKEEFTALWRAEGSPAGPAPDAWLEPALTIIKRWEGCKLTAYPDPGTGGEPWTVGWGSTRINGQPVRPGQTISQAEADALLLEEVNAKGAQVLGLLPMAKDWKAEQIAALVSWAYNVGIGAVADSTLRRRMLAGQDPATVVKVELPRWNQAGGRVMQGLVNRRADEVALFVGAPKLEIPAQQPAKITPQSPFSTRITPHIRLGEFALDQDARRFDHSWQVDTAAELAAFLERVRRNFSGKPIIITSGYRNPTVNSDVGGASQSEHLYSEPGEGAVDFRVEGADINAVQAFCDKHWPYSVGYGAAKGFVHLGRRADGKKRRWDYG